MTSNENHSGKIGAPVLSQAQTSPENRCLA